MVISKDGKRKRKYNTSNILPQTPELPKRTKVHAQRKFAQGQGIPSSSFQFQNLANVSQTSTTSKETSQPKPAAELIPNKRPNTEDFLTFLCFRGTPILPPHLDYFNAANRTSTETTALNNNSTSTENGTHAVTATTSTNVTINADTVLTKPENLETMSSKEVKKEAPGFIPFGVRKRAEQIPDRKHHEKVQALRKKYHEQRMAKLRGKRFNKSRSTIQTRSNIVQSPIPAKEIESVDIPKIIPKKAKEFSETDETPPIVKRKLGLRSGDDVNVNTIVEKPIKQVKIEVKPTPLNKKLTVKKEKKQILPKTEDVKLDIEIESKITDSPKKTRAAIKISPPRQTRQTKQPSLHEEEENKNESDFSSDDDEPLVNSIIKTSKLNIEVASATKRTRSKRVFGQNSNNISTELNIEKTPNLKNISLDDQNSKPVEATKEITKRTKLKKKVVKSPIKRDSSVASKSDTESKISGRKIIIKKVATTRKYVKRKYKKQKSDTEHDKPVELSQTDVSEPENRTSRPSRKTKEAATIYMELIGRKLNQEEADIDDDDESNDSFPELPNVRKTEKMEIELKANYNKDKSKNEGSHKKKQYKHKGASPKKFISAPAPKNLNATETQSESDNFECIKSKVRKKILIEEKIKNKEAFIKKIIAESKPQLEKSFSDSDEEPLASKIPKKKKSPEKPKTIVSKMSPVKILMPQKSSDQPLQVKTHQQISVATVTQNLEITPNKIQIDSPKIESKLPEIPVEVEIKTPTPPITPIKQVIINLTPEKKFESPKVKFDNPNLMSPFTRTHFLSDIKDDHISTKVNRSSDFNSKSDTSPTKLSKSLENENDIMKKLREVEEMAILKSENSAKQMKLTTSSTMRDLMNPLPSMEESGKIFGIASVSLAQSSGPVDTKCTLGKCGSIHKPPLGPVVPTEAILGEQLSSKERRRAKVNMTHEQIQRWLVESCVTPDPDDLPFDTIDDEIDIKVPPKPINYLSSPSPFKDEPSTSYKSIKSKQNKVQVKKEKFLPTMAKGPTLKAKAVVTKEEIKKEKNEDENKISFVAERKPTQIQDRKVVNIIDRKLPQSIERKTPLVVDRKAQNIASKSKLFDKLKNNEPTTPSPVTIDLKSNDGTSSPKPNLKAPTTLSKEPADNKINKIDSKQLPKLQVVEEKSISPEKSKCQSKELESKTKDKSQTKVKENTSIKVKENQSATSKAVSSVKVKENAPQKPLSTTDRKLIFNQRRTPVYNTKIPETSMKKSVINTFGAFSPENETSVYSFDKEEDVVPIAKPFRRHSRRESNSSKHEDSSDKVTKDVKKEITTSVTLDTSTPKKNSAIQPEVSLTLSPEDNTKSASIAVQVSLDEMLNSRNKITSTEKSIENNDSDSEGHTFYIPLQGANITGGKSDQIIQGVAVKLGTEGPEGPNQRVIMHAKLVTKTQMGSTTTPLPESLGNVQEIVKSLIAKEASGSKSVPIGTVQPRFKSSDSAAEPVPQQSTSQLTRVNSSSSLFSQKSKLNKFKLKNDAPVQMSNNTTFPRRDDPAQMVEAPIFRPTEKDFQDPMEYIERISATASRFGLCKIIPPDSFKPDCQLSDDIRFIAYNQYIHKMLNRWGPSTKELCAIRKYLLTQNIQMIHPPLIGGMEVDLPRLYHTVQELGGLKDVIEKKKWARVAEEMCIPKTAHDRVTKLDDIYCKYLLPYDTLSPSERQKLFDEVETDWAKREARARRNADRCVHNTSSVDSNDASEDDESEDCDESEGDTMECQFKGRSMPLSAFFRVARNTMSVWFKNTEPDTTEIEAEFWRHVAVRDSHICVHAGSIDSSGYGYGFPTPGPKTKSSPCAKHPWNLKVLTNHCGSVLRSLGPVMGVTVPTLQFGMLFTACCWYRDPHGLPWIEYLHTGSSKIWYGVPDDQSSNFRAALSALVPTHCQNKTIWLPSDTAMVPPHMLTDRNVSLSRTEQMPGEFVVVFSRAYTSSVCTGYVVSESVYFATNTWLESAKQDYKDIQESCEPAVFSLEQLLFAISSDTRSNLETLVQILPMVTDMYEKEVASRRKVKAAGLIKEEKLVAPKNRRVQNEENECDTCRANLYISMVKSDDESIYCTQHAIKYLNNKQIEPNQCKLIYTYSIEEIEQMLEGLKERINQHRNKLNNKKMLQHGKNQGGKYNSTSTSGK